MTSPEGEGLNRVALVAHARESIARGSRSFALASRLFDRTTRERVWLLYGWCRACDDLADGQDHGGAMGRVVEPAARLMEFLLARMKPPTFGASVNPAHRRRARHVVPALAATRGLRAISPAITDQTGKDAKAAHHANRDGDNHASGR